MDNIISKNTGFSFHFLEVIILRISSVILPLLIFGAIPKIQFGYWGQIEGQIVFVHMICAIVAINMAFLLIKYRKFANLIYEPLIFIPFLIGILSLFLSCFHRITNLSLYGSPQIGEGPFWYFDLGIMTMLYALVWSDKRWRVPLLILTFCVIFFVTLFSFKPVLGAYELQFFFFFDYLCFFGIAFAIIFISTYKEKNYILKILSIKNISVILFLCLGPYFWLLDNKSAAFVWFITSLLWIFISFIKSYVGNSALKESLINIIYSPYMFTFSIILASICILSSSFIFWDGISFTNDMFTPQANPIVAHLATLVARGSIIRVLLEHFNSIEAFIFGYGWGSTSDLLISSFTIERFNQINTGSRVHFHTHNELFEHFISMGILGLVSYVSYAFFVFKRAFEKGSFIPYFWILYFVESCFYFQFISSLPFLALASATMLKYEKINDRSELNIEDNRNNFSFSFILLLTVVGSLSYASFIGFFTNINTEVYGPDRMISLSKSTNQENCHISVYDYGRGGIHLANMYDGYSSYIKDQYDSGQPLNESDVDVLKWYLCASHNQISSGNTTIELINADINVISFLSTANSEKLGFKIENLRNDYLKIWDNRIRLLLSLAPSRIDQITPYISVLLKENKFEEIISICANARKYGKDIPYCDLAEAAIYIEEGAFDKAVKLIEDAEKRGAFEKKISLREGMVGADEDLVKIIMEFVKNYRSKNN